MRRKISFKYGEIMKNCFLFELGCEEIPHHSQKYIQKIWTDHIKNALTKVSINNYDIKFFLTPRRVAVQIINIPDEIEIPELIIKGPEISNKIAVENFLIKNNVSISDCSEQNINNKQSLILKIPSKKILIDALLKEICKKFVHETNGPKMMSWNNGNNNWFRPIHTIVCMFNDKVIDWSYNEITSSNQTLPHRFYENLITINHAQNYQEILEKNHIIPSYEDRFNIIKSKFISELTKYECDINDIDEELIDKIAGLVEFPSICIGKFDERFLELPVELISTVLKNHQNSFIFKKDKKPFPYFAFISNSLYEDKSKIISGNEKVILARLSDAEFFYKIDLSKEKSFYVEKIKNKVFHEKLGCFFDKIERLKSYVSVIQKYDKNFNGKILFDAIDFSKYDLTFETIREFPELQGIIGSYYYANHCLDSFNHNIVNAIYEQYSINPSSQLGGYLSLLDNLDKIICFFCIDIKPTSSGDPYGIRRSGNIVGSILLKSEFSLKILKSSIVDILEIVKKTIKNVIIDKNLNYEIYQFIIERIRKILLQEHSINFNILTDLDENISFHEFLSYIIELSRFYKSNEINDIKFIYKRIKGINKSDKDLNIENVIQSLKTCNYEFSQKLIEFFTNKISLINEILLIKQINNSVNKFLENERIEKNENNLLIILGINYLYEKNLKMLEE